MTRIDKEMMKEFEKFLSKKEMEKTSKPEKEKPEYIDSSKCGIPYCGCCCVKKD